MDEDYSTNALTEISLALAMGIFALMVLALISMGPSQTIANQELHQIKFVGIDVTPSYDSASVEQSTLDDSDLFVIFFDGALYDRKLEKVPRAQIERAGRVIVGIEPDMPATKLAQVRSDIDHSNVLVTPLSEAWQQALREYDQF